MFVPTGRQEQSRPSRVASVLASGPLLAMVILSFAASTLGACASPGATNPSPGSSAVSSSDAAGQEVDVASALEDPHNEAFPTPLIDPDLLLAGGPPPDGIPPIDNPGFEVAKDVDWLEGNEAVMILTVEGETRAYPLRIMTWHEIVNDSIGGKDVAVTYCPLCNSGVAFERAVAGHGVLSFGTSGLLYADNLVMYDRQTESLWPQLTGVASVGVLTGIELVSMPMGTITWNEFLASHPHSGVLSRDTGMNRDYGANPYRGYDDPDSDVMFPLPSELDGRLRAKERVIGLTDGLASVAIVRADLVGNPPLEILLGSRPLVVWHQPGQASALDADEVAGGADIGSVGVFDPVLDDRQLHFDASEDGFVDRETGSTWNILGEGTAGEFSGRKLDRQTHLDTFWFSWISFHPTSRIVAPR